MILCHGLLFSDRQFFLFFNNRMQRFSFFLKLLAQEIIQESPYYSDRPKLYQMCRGRGNNRSYYIRSELKFKCNNKPSPKHRSEIGMQGMISARSSPVF